MIEVAAIVIRNPQGHVLTVRKKSSTKYQLPGGKLEEGEALVDAALREVSEEVGLHLDAENLDKLGTFGAPAAEIGDIAWVNPAAPDRELAHLLRDRVFPALN